MPLSIMMVDGDLPPRLLSAETPHHTQLSLCISSAIRGCGFRFRDYVMLFRTKLQVWIKLLKVQSYMDVLDLGPLVFQRRKLPLPCYKG